jgi:hypothetical protein
MPWSRINTYSRFMNYNDLQPIVTTNQSGKPNPMTQQRHETRFDGGGQAKIVMAQSEVWTICTVHGLSNSGALLEVGREEALPETFILVPDDGDPLGCACRAVSRKGCRVNAAFQQHAIVAGARLPTGPW